VDSPGQGRVVFRFAPSPNGFLHLGHALSALINADAAKQCDGTCLLRIEDIDTARCRPQFEAAIYRDLAWLGIEWRRPVRRQSEHFELYRESLGHLSRRGLLYPCFCSRADISRAVAALATRRDAPWPYDPDGAPLYPGTCGVLSRSEASRRISAGQSHALRLRVGDARQAAGDLAWREHASPEPGSAWRRIAADPTVWGDVVLGRREAPASYHLAVVADDAAQAVTHVVRGLDLLAATAIHRLLQRLLGLPEPNYHHHRLVLDDRGRKLSKSLSSTSLRELRAQGVSPAEIRRRIGLGRASTGIAPC
jgi:glutamyl-Q tRNA(Asp) synthetase